MTIKHNSQPYNIDDNDDSFCAHLDTVVPVLRHDCDHTTHPAVTVVPVLRFVLFMCIKHIIVGTVGLIVANVYPKSNYKTATSHWVPESRIFQSVNLT